MARRYPQPVRPSTLRNLGQACDEMLAAAGIDTVDELEDAGAVEAFVRVRQTLGSGVSIVLLYALEGALIDCDWRELPTGLKDASVAEAKRRLAETPAS